MIDKALATLAMLTSALLFPGVVCAQQQMSDRNYRPAIAAVEPEGERPLIAIDQAHGNFHELRGRYAPFAVLARHGGYRVVASNTLLEPDYLADIDILLIGNSTPDDSGVSFTEAEVDALLEWIADGGSLFLIADHHPFSAGAIPIAARFGVDMGNGYVVAGRRSQASGTIDYDVTKEAAHPILSGASAERRVGKVRLFLGQSLGVPEGADILLTLPQSAVELSDRQAMARYREGGQDGVDVSGRAQAIAIEHGAGRIVISAEAAMFTKQVVVWQDGSETHVGVNQLDNEAYALNILDWLARRLN